ncbi:hypothetical protein H0O00_05120 [Candidatus Micrarchaeota archaeon]|nr:hypothetical protein [Candidatus Micrarchaeota archaeon]
MASMGGSAETSWNAPEASARQAAKVVPGPKYMRKLPLVEKLICWDLDETLGQFYGIYARINGHQSSRRDVLRPGIREALHRLSVLGFTHVVTTVAPERQAHEALRASGLFDLFSGVFHEQMILRDGRKDYSVVAKSFGIPDEERRKRIISVGDILELDMHRGGVSIWEPDSPYHSAGVTADFIKLMSESGDGNFWDGFRTIFSKAGESKRLNQDSIHIHVADGFDTSLFYQEASAIACIRVQDHFRENPVPLPAPDAGGGRGIQP